MKFAYMCATPEVKEGPYVTALMGSLQDTAGRVAQAGFTAAELLVADPAALNPKDVAAAFSDVGIEICAVCTGEVYGQDRISFADPRPEVRHEAIERMCKAMELAAPFAAPVNVGRLRGRYIEGVDPARTLAWIAAALRTCTERVPGVGIVMEPVNHQYENCLMTTRQMADFVAGLDMPHVRVMLDLAHILEEGEAPDEALDLVHQAFGLSHIHITDSERLPLGEGTYDIEPFLRSLERRSYDGYITVETFQIPDQQHALQRSATYLKTRGWLPQ